VLWGSPYGATVRGYAALNAVHRSLMAAGAAPPSRYEVVQSLSPLPGVAIVHVRRDDLAAGSGGGFSEMAMYVLVERDGQWWLAAGQNTPVAERRRHLGHGRFRRLSWLGRLLPAITGERLRNSKTIRDKAVPSMLATGAGPLAALPARHLRQNRS